MKSSPFEVGSVVLKLPWSYKNDFPQFKMVSTSPHTLHSTLTESLESQGWGVK